MERENVFGDLSSDGVEVYALDGMLYEDDGDGVTSKRDTTRNRMALIADARFTILELKMSQDDYALKHIPKDISLRGQDPFLTVQEAIEAIDLGNLWGKVESAMEKDTRMMIQQRYPGKIKQDLLESMLFTHLTT